VSLVVGCLLGLVAVGLIAGGGGATWLDNTQRDATGYVTSGTHVFATGTYALVGDRIDLGGTDVAAPSAILGTVRIRVTASDPADAVFVGIAPRAAADRYLAGVGRAAVSDWATGTVDVGSLAGGPPPVAPTAASIWVASASGTGTQTLTWKPTGGEWTVVVMRPDGTAGIAVAADAGATFPVLGWIAGGLFAAGGVLLVGAVLLVVLSVARAGRSPAPTDDRS
jgi:hypothetical protein